MRASVNPLATNRDLSAAGAELEREQARLQSVVQAVEEVPDSDGLTDDQTEKLLLLTAKLISRPHLTSALCWLLGIR